MKTAKKYAHLTLAIAIATAALLATGAGAANAGTTNKPRFNKRGVTDIGPVRTTDPAQLPQQ